MCGLMPIVTCATATTLASVVPWRQRGPRFCGSAQQKLRISTTLAWSVMGMPVNSTESHTLIVTGDNSDQESDTTELKSA